jgi:hypothetical protein
MAIYCPQCGKNDRVEKVSAVYSGGLAQTKASIKQDVSMLETLFSSKPQTTKTFTTQETTQTNLSRKLSPPTGIDETQLGYISIGFILAVFVICGVTTQNMTVAMIFGGIAFVVALVAGVWYQVQTKERQKTVMPVWNRLYYCFRDDCVFDPTTGAFAPIEKANDLLKPRWPNQQMSASPAPTLPSTLPTPTQVQTATSHPVVNLSGMWSAKGYDCTGLVPEEIIEIKQTGQALVATKVTGDECVRAGETTFIGAMNLASIPGIIKVQVLTSLGPNSTTRQYIDAVLEIVSSDLLYLGFEKDKISFSRIRQ